MAINHIVTYQLIYKIVQSFYVAVKQTPKRSKCPFFWGGLLFPVELITKSLIIYA